MEELLNRADGFTLIELMIVILIIAVLVAIAVPVYLNARTNARLRTCQTNMRTVDGAVSEYEAVFQGPIPYPSSLDVMTNPGTKTLKAVPECPEASNSSMKAPVKAAPIVSSSIRTPQSFFHPCPALRLHTP